MSSWWVVPGRPQGLRIHDTATAFVARAAIRDRFSRAESTLYQAEVPQSESPLALVEQRNREAFEAPGA
ncbi:hypothetical protein [Halomonas maura]|uniref:hypothetical protein n=1 Tax=Halomonas maura TaxID=117606 RepID=UPI0025B2FDE0|nr:hypothetical protein [Halomonas maura]MDN3555814.1 hypothetical protein [Halomonas maura]